MPKRRVSLRKGLQNVSPAAPSKEPAPSSLSSAISFVPTLSATCLDESLVLSQATNDCDVGWDNQLPASICSDPDVNMCSTEELILKLATSSRQGTLNHGSKTPPLLQPSTESPGNQDGSHQVVNRCRRLRKRARPSGIKQAMESKQLIQRLASAMQENDRKKSEVSTSRPENTAPFHQHSSKSQPETSPCKDHQGSPSSSSANNSLDLFESTARPNPDTSAKSSIQVHESKHTESPVSVDKANSDSMEELWMDEEALDDSLIQATQDLFDSEGFVTPKHLKYKSRTSTPDASTGKKTTRFTFSLDATPVPVCATSGHSVLTCSAVVSHVGHNAPLAAVPRPYSSSTKLQNTKTVVSSSCSVLPCQSSSVFKYPDNISVYKQSASHAVNQMSSRGQCKISTAVSSGFKSQGLVVTAGHSSLISSTAVPPKSSSSSVNSGILNKSAKSTHVSETRRTSAQQTSSTVTSYNRSNSSSSSVQSNVSLSNQYKPGAPLGDCSKVTSSSMNSNARNACSVSWNKQIKASDANVHVSQDMSASHSSKSSLHTMSSYHPSYTSTVTLCQPARAASATNNPVTLDDCHELSDDSISDDLLATLADPDEVLDSQVPTGDPQHTLPLLSEEADEVLFHVEDDCWPTSRDVPTESADDDDMEDDLEASEVLAMLEEAELKATQMELASVKTPAPVITTTTSSVTFGHILREQNKCLMQLNNLPSSTCHKTSEPRSTILAGAPSPCIITSHPPCSTGPLPPVPSQPKPPLCSQADIERKRKEALARRANKLSLKRRE